MNVDDALWIFRHKRRRKNLHVTRQHHQINLVFAQQFKLPALSLLGRREVMKRNPKMRRHGAQVSMVGDDQRNLTAQFA